MENLGADLGLVVLSPFWAHGPYVETVAPQEELRRAGWAASGERNTQGQAFPTHSMDCGSNRSYRRNVVTAALVCNNRNGPLRRFEP